MKKLHLDDTVSEKLRLHLLEILTSPSLIELRSDGTLNIDEDVNYNTTIDVLSSKLPAPPDLSSITDETERREARIYYQVTCIRSVLGYTEGYIDKKLSDGVSYEKVKQSLTELGKDVELILAAITRKFTVTQSSEQQWGKYALRYEEVIELEQVASLRREINVRRSNWDLSAEYAKASKEKRAKEEARFELEIKTVTTTLWRILHLGAQYLSANERLNMKSVTEDMSKADALSYVTGELVKLRRAHLSEYRKDPNSYRLPKVKS